MKTLNTAIIICLFTSLGFGQKIKLVTANHLMPFNTEIADVKFKGKNALKVKAIEGNKLAIVKIPTFNFEDGIIEFDMASNRAIDAHPDNRGFAGMAFHLSEDNDAFDCIYLRATNGRAENQVQRNHTVQYFALPDFHFPTLRAKFPEKYETYVDVIPDEWIHLKIVVERRMAKLYVADQSQPTLIVSELLNKKTSGGIALWVGGGTDAYFTNLTITKHR
ncbi:hypothetical protein IC229_24905 [Spirosoma sp. BT702]|uniref:DUF1080 domain-containing protein n=1 Tax=Spirosoma profusum TaxID=2771354 RepID=A0A926Y3Z9_9BACT|nr:hypothetical protein [Spirosoma profusum]MBD2703908.1 hypothetical protein [Spirosoma profusum]